MEIVFVTAEMEPFAKTGGLADVCGSLPHEIARLGHSVSVFLPKYRSVSEHRFSLKVVIPEISIPLGSEVEKGKLYGGRHGELSVFFDSPRLVRRLTRYRASGNHLLKHAEPLLPRSSRHPKDQK